MRLILFILLLPATSVYSQRNTLAGDWRFAIDREDKGIQEKWFNKTLPGTATLPGSMAQNGKGDNVTLYTKWTGSIYDSSFFFRPSLAKYRTANNLKIPFWLTPIKHYTGRAWYQQDIIVLAGQKDREARLFLERVHTQTRVWINGREVGGNNSLSTPQVFNLGKLKPGKYTITLCIDNRIDDMNVGPDSHSVSDHTQGNWNGIVGKIYVETLPLIRFDNIQVYPDVKNKQARIKVSLINTGVKTDVMLLFAAKSYNTNIKQQTGTISKRATLPANDTTVVEINLPLGKNVLLWDEFDPALYLLEARVSGAGSVDQREVQFGMREFKIAGMQFTINGRPVFLRGTLNNCEFPLTGYPAMNVPAWERIFSVAKSYGLNHMRFHSWCPPEAAFIAADKIGFYLQPEAPTWPNHGTSVGDGRFIDQYIYDETNRIVNSYGNYASFCMLAAGNEPAGRNQAKYLAAFVNYWKAKDHRRVYTGASVAMSWPLVPENQYMVKSGPRGLRWTNAEPESVSDYEAAIKDFSVPYVTHEMGQWCVFPDFDEIKKYTGVYRARNFELFQEDLKDHGMADQAKDFLMASGKLQALCYKAEIEKDLRTKGLAGFQLLGLQDFPGQGTALVGVVNVFWQPKPYISAAEFSRFCNATVPLARLPKFTFTNNEHLEAGIELFHYGKKNLENAVVVWAITNERGDSIQSGKFSPQTYITGGVRDAGKLNIPLKDFVVPGHFKLIVSVENSSVSNDWDFFVYRAELARADINWSTSAVHYCTELDEKAEEVLKNGGIVYLNAAGKVVKGKEISMYFTPVFWNTSWFKMRPPHVTGMFIQSSHPAFAQFPTSFYSDYQWWGIVNKTQVMHLEDFPKTFRPLVQPIDTWFMNRRLALIFEAKVGKGTILVTSVDISGNSPNPVARQLYYSLRQYVLSGQFKPKDEIDIELIKDLFKSPSKETWDSFTKDSPDELKPLKNEK
jgi:hypothetical protein